MTNQHADEREPEPVISSLQPDAEWKNIQLNTFTRWVNNHLKKCPDEIHNLETDLSDGLKLIKLVEVLSQRHVGRYSTQVKFRHQKLENVSVALNYLQNDEGIKIVNIDSSHIVDQNKKLILGLIWTLILHYSISIHMEEDERPSGEPDRTPKQRLLQWIRKKLPDDVPVTNFTYDWNDGLALGGLVNSISPDSVVDWRTWEPDNALENTKTAMNAAAHELGVAPLISPEELINPNVDEKSVMTYLAQFPQAVKEISEQSADGEVKPPLRKGKLHGIESTAIVHRPSDFHVIMPTDEHKPKISIQDDHGADIHFTVHKIPATCNYNVKYTPEKTGMAKISLFTTSITTGESVASDSAEVRVIEGARLLDFGEVGKVGETKAFHIENAGEGPVDMVIVDSEGKEHSLAVIESTTAGCYSAAYLLETPGTHSVNAFHRGTPISGSPFRLRVLPKSSWEVWGRGLQPDGICVGDKAPIYVQPSSSDSGDDTNKAPISVEIVDGHGRKVAVTRTISHGKVKFEYTPTTEGVYQVHVLNGGEPIGQTPYVVSVGPTSRCPVRAFGPGLEGGIAQQPNLFYVNTHGDSDHLAFTIEGPSKTSIECADRGQGQALVEYTPKESGVYKINILSKGEHIKDSPFVVWVDPADQTIRPSAVRVTGLEEKKAIKGEKTTFRVDTKNAGTDLVPEVTVIDGKYGQTIPSMREVNPGLFECSFTPKDTGNHFVNVGVKAVAVPGSPFPVNVEEKIDASKLKIFGPGVEGPVVSQQPTHFTIDAKQAGPGAVEVALADRDGRAVDIDVLDNQDGSFTVKYTAPRPGAYQLNVVFAGVDGPPIEINVKPHIDRGGIRVEGLENAIVTVNCEKEVHVFTSDGENTRILITSPSGRVVEALIEATPTGFRVLFTPSEIGDYSISVTYEDLPIDQGPFLLHSVPQDGANASEAEYVVSRSGPPRADLVRVSGPGLGPVIATRSTHVHIDASRAGFGNIDLFVDGPTRTPIHCVDNHDGTCSMYYVPRIPGMYWLRVMFEEQHVPGSPFQVVACAPMLSSPKIIADRDKTASPFTSLSSGSSTPQQSDVLTGHLMTVKVDTGKNVPVSKGLQLFASLPDGKRVLIPIEKSSTNQHQAQFIANDIGNTKLELFFDEIAIEDALIRVLHGQNASKCRAFGPGLEKAIVGEKASFQIDTQGAGDGALALEISGPMEAETEVIDFQNGSCQVDYITKEPGPYQIAILYGDDRKHIPGSPFMTFADYKKDSSKIKVETPENGEHRLGSTSDIIVDASKTANGEITAHLPHGQNQPRVTSLSSRRGVSVVEVNPQGKPGEIVPLEICYDGIPVEGSPFPLRLMAQVDASKARLEGSGGGLSTVDAGKDAHLLLDTSQCGKVKTVAAAITGPDGHSRRCSMKETTDQLHQISFPTDLAGVYSVEAMVNGEKIAEKPTRVHARPVGNLENAHVKVRPLDEEWLVGEEKYLVIEREEDEPEAQLSLLKSHPESLMAEIVQRRVDGKIQDHVVLRALEPGKQSVNVVYGGDLLPDGNLSFEEREQLGDF